MYCYILLDMTVREFQKNISKNLDLAIQGEKITIERAGVVFTVTANVKVRENV